MRNAEPPMPPHVQLIQMAGGNRESQILYVAAKLGLADHLAKGARTAEEIAGPTGTHAPSLYRLMRALGNLGILSEDSAHRFSLTPLGDALKTGAPGCARPSILVLGSPMFTAGFGELLYSVQSGKSGFEHKLGMPIFDWFSQHPEEAGMFNEMMVGFHGAEPAAVAAAYDFSGVSTLIDVGGGTGNLLTTILARFPKIRGVLYDLPHVIKEAPPMIRSRNLTDRVKLEAGSFFDKVPAGGDAYMMSHIIHDWTEDKCLKILGNCRQAMSPSARLLLIEMVLPPGNTPHPGKMLDITMLVGPGGQERSEPEYAELLAKAGLRLKRVVPTESAVSIVEAVRQ